jgi:hypothetical protein
VREFWTTFVGERGVFWVWGKVAGYISRRDGGFRRRMSLMVDLLLHLISLESIVEQFTELGQSLSEV